MHFLSEIYLEKDGSLKRIFMLHNNEKETDFIRWDVYVTLVIWSESESYKTCLMHVYCYKLTVTSCAYFNNVLLFRNDSV
jgi:hypothetical protein